MNSLPNHHKGKRYSYLVQLFSILLLIAIFRISATRAAPQAVGPVVYDGHVIDDDNTGASGGNNNGQVDCGENIELSVWLLNEGTSTAPWVLARIDSTDLYVTSIIDPEPQDPDIPGRERILFPGLYFEIASNTPDGHNVTFDLTIGDDLGNFWYDTFAIPIACASTPSPPPNDDFDDAYVIESLPYSNVQSTDYSTAAADDPTTSCSNDWGQNVWYRFPATDSGLVRFQTVGSSYDTWLAIYTGTRGNLTEVACNDDHPDIVGLASRIDMLVTAGTTYHLWFGGDDNDVGDLVFEVTVLATEPATPTLYNIANSDKDGNYSVDWSSVSGANNYRLQEQFNSGGWSTIYDGIEISETVIGRVDGTWCYRVSASNIGGTSEWSDSKCSIVNTTQYVNFIPAIGSGFFSYPPYKSDQETEPNDVWQQANGALISKQIYHGAFNTQDDIDDYYFFYMQKEGNVNVKLSDVPDGQNYDLVLRDWNIALVGYSGELGNANESIVEDLPEGLYFVQVYNRSQRADPNNYSLQVNYEE